MVGVLFKKLIIFSLLLFIPLYIIQMVVDKGLRKYQSGEYGIWNDIYSSKINSDILIVGSSRALVNISSPILDSALHKTVYGIGVNGGNFSQTLVRLKVYLQHNKKPQTIICSLGMNDLDKGEGLFNTEQYMPYLEDSLIRNSNQGYANSFMLADYYIPAMKYRSDLGSLLTGIKLYFNSQVEVREPRIKGYVAREIKWDTSFDDLRKSKKVFNIKFHKELLNDFKTFIGICKSNNIKLIFVFTPEYEKVQPYFKNWDFVMNFYKSVAAKNDIPFLDYSNSEFSKDTKYFYNSEHLNKTGSQLFSKKLADDLLKLQL